MHFKTLCFLLDNGADIHEGFLEFLFAHLLQPDAFFHDLIDLVAFDGDFILHHLLLLDSKLFGIVVLAHPSHVFIIVFAVPFEASPPFFGEVHSSALAEVPLELLHVLAAFLIDGLEASPEALQFSSKSGHLVLRVNVFNFSLHIANDVLNFVSDVLDQVLNRSLGVVPNSTLFRHVIASCL